MPGAAAFALKAAGFDLFPHCPPPCLFPTYAVLLPFVLSSGKRNNLEDFVIVEIERPRLPGPYDRQFDLFPRRLRGIEQVWLAFPVARTILRESLSPQRLCVILFFFFVFLFSPLVTRHFFALLFFPAFAFFSTRSFHAVRKAPAGCPILCVSVVRKGWGVDSTQSPHKPEPFDPSAKP